MDFPPKVVASVTNKDDAREAIALGADIVEARIDLAGGDAEDLVKSIYNDIGCPIIVTVRPVFEGGSFQGTDQERIRLFSKLAPYAEYVDVELRSRNLDELIGTVQGTKAMPLVSYHDFDRTPSIGEMLSILERSLEKGAIAKLAVTPRDMGDVLRLLEVTLKSKRPVCTIAMGSLGQHSRLMAPVYGSLLTYGYVRRPVAPGQIRVDQLLQGLKILGLR
ncbi:MAG TPA: type I 3-dehydroquinate dehydratase [Methanocella sp.]|nr:type I 3-dehydroquinate dehydratase [Methanocella sp.]